MEDELSAQDGSPVNFAPGTAVTNTDNSLLRDPITLSLTQCLERADCIHVARHTESSQSIFPSEKFTTLTIAGATVSVTNPDLGYKLNFVAGLGTTSSAGESDLEKIELAHSRVGISTMIELCPYADKKTLTALALRGFNAVGFLIEYIRPLTDISVNDTIETRLSETHSHTSISISRVQVREHETFVQHSVEGFCDTGRSPLILDVLARVATLRADSLLYFAKIHEEIGATGALAVIETPYGRIGYLYHGSTVPRFRKRGLHRALDWARLLDARQRGCDLALVQAQTGSSSGRNAERLGFRLAYTKTLFCKELHFI
ncbi:hypothetical protein BGZ63DRAFT_425060 [Mariannaea sp. PMI_226]|nr:hypothetical protein BGZ63DRAFT_425060 [Mariannaea sp. PMI_226]